MSRPKRTPISLAQLQAAITSPDQDVRYNAIGDYSLSTVSSDAIPVLLEALKDPYPGVVRYAAICLGKLGPEAKNYKASRFGNPPIIQSLLSAAHHCDPDLMMPQAYPDCLEALMKIDPKNPFVLELIHSHIGCNNWYFVKASFQAMKAIGTPASLELLNRSVTFWMPELNKMQKRIVEKILAGS